MTGILYFDAKGAKETSAFEYGGDWLSAQDRYPARAIIAVGKRAAPFRRGDTLGAR